MTQTSTHQKTRGLAVLVAILAVAAAIAAFGASGETKGVVKANGVRVSVPAGWEAVTPAKIPAVTDPKTLLVVGTPRVRPHASRCQVAAYAIPAGGAAVVVIGWKSLATAGGAHPAAGRALLRSLRKVRVGDTECFAGAGASAQLWLAHRAFQVNVLVARGASATRVREALAVARFFDLAR
jgi:hypothetical protein